MRIALIRHGQTDWNAEHRFQGSADIPLNDTGRKQAAEAVELLRGSPWTTVVSSTLDRANETARIIAKALDLGEVRAYPEFVERSYGEGEGRLDTEMSRSEEEFERMGVEAEDAVVARALKGLDEVARDFPGQNVLIVCHGTIIRLLLEYLIGLPMPHIANAAISEIDGEPGDFEVHRVNGIPVKPNGDRLDGEGSISPAVRPLR